MADAAHARGVRDPSDARVLLTGFPGFLGSALLPRLIHPAAMPHYGDGLATAESVSDEALTEELLALAASRLTRPQDFP